MTKLLALALVIYILYRYFRKAGNIFKTITGQTSEENDEKREAKFQNNAQKKRKRKYSEDDEYVDFEEINDK